VVGCRTAGQIESSLASIGLNLSPSERAEAATI
jgi:hypothetical protein